MAVSNDEKRAIAIVDLKVSPISQHRITCPVLGLAEPVLVLSCDDMHKAIAKDSALAPWLRAAMQHFVENGGAILFEPVVIHADVDVP